MGKVAQILSISLVTGLGVLGSGSSVRADTTQSSYSYSSVQGHRAADFLNSLGIGAGFSSPAPRYNVNAIVNDLAYIGFKHVRGSIGSFNSSRPNYYFTHSSWAIPPSFNGDGTRINDSTPGNTPITSAQLLQMLASIGVRIDVLLYLKDPTPKQNWLDNNAAYLESIEGPNEVNLARPEITYDGLTKLAAGVAVQKTLYSMVKSDPKLANIPVYNITIGHPGLFVSSQASTGNLAPYSDYGNIHPYAPSGAPPYRALVWNMEIATNTPGKSFVATETGYPTAAYNPIIAAATRSGANIVSENVQARYLLDTVFDAFNLRIVKTYIYNLIDSQCDPDDTNAEMHFGIFRCDNTPKPSAVAFHNLREILQDSGASAFSFTPAPLNYTLQQSLTTPASDVGKFHTLLQKQDGTYELVLWGEPKLWDNRRHAEITAGMPVNNVTVTLNKPYQTINVYDPLTGSKPVSQSSNTNRITVTVSDHPVIVEIQ